MRRRQLKVGAFVVMLAALALSAVSWAQQPAAPAPAPGQVIRLQPGAPAQPGGGVIQVAPGTVVQPGAADTQGTIAEQPAPTGVGGAVAFWVFAVLAVGGAIATITRKNAITAVMWLVATFFAIAAIYAMLFAHFMAAIQVLVYAGAIMVLFVFVVMILNKEEEEPWAMRGIIGKALAVGTLIYFLFRLVDVMWSVKDVVREKAWAAGELAGYGTTKAVGKELFTSYLFPFEAVTIALLIAIVGAVVLAHPEHATEVGAEPKPGTN